MTIGNRNLSFLALVALGGVAVLSPKAVLGQEFSDEFMFHVPRVTLTFNLGYAVPTAGSDVFDEVTDMLTLDKGDFHAPSIGGGLSIWVKDRIDLTFEFSYAKSSTWSEYVDWVDNSDLPIEQETRLTQVPVTASFKYFLMDRGRQIGNLSWISTKWAPYIGIGGGGMFYEFEQVGDFVDFEDYSVFGASFVSEGWSWVGHAFGGLQWAISPQWIVTVEGRYSHSDADLDRPSYVGYEPIDLSGFQGTLGFGVRF